MLPCMQTPPFGGFNDFYAQIAGNRLSPWLETLPPRLAAWQAEQTRQSKGAFSRALPILAQLPELSAERIELASEVRFESAADAASQARLTGLLKQLKPWRKGPFHLHGVEIDTEWRSDWKWERLAPHISPLADRYVLDVGCGSGYHLWRMRGAGATLALGIDPYALFFAQFLAIRHFNPDPHVRMLPLGIDELPPLPAFDTVFAMGVLYHRRAPLDFLQQLAGLLRPGGELVVETLVVEGDETCVLMPAERYARMPNVWFIPSVAALTRWLQRLGFQNIRLADLNRTSTAEQRRTDWMDFESLADCLDPQDPSLSVEGYPAPLRAILIANRPA